MPEILVRSSCSGFQAKDLGYALPQDHRKLLLGVMVVTMVATVLLLRKGGKPNRDSFS